MEWPDRKVGYADLMPWPEFGDPNLEQQLASLKRGHLTKLLEQSIWLGRKDALMRAIRRNGIDDAPKVRNHFTIADYQSANSMVLNSAKAMGFNTLKVKVGRDWTSELQWLLRTLRDYSFFVRLDFNAKGDFSTFERMITSVPVGLRTKLEFAEDPFKFDMESWTEASKILSLAIDLEYDKVPFSQNLAQVPFKYIVIKPARQDVNKALKIAEQYKLKVVVSSSMDHPIGVSHALRLAGEVKNKIGTRLTDCGCLTLRVYNDNEYSTKIITQGPFLTKVPGTGIGFDDILARQKWIPVLINAG
jgi:O-succinylbenzoate synthase